jgi:serine/threonine protein kinase
MDLQPEVILHERYKIIEKLGQGGMGAVYLAWDNTLETRVAVKSNFNPAPESVDQFLMEAQLLASLRHQNLPRVTDYFVIGKEQYLVMDFVPGDDLGKRLKDEGTQRVQDVLFWADQMCSALSYMHQQDPPVIHRDIKPANIKLTPENEVILVDFGIAKAASAQVHTATGAAGYTPGYAPPEQYGQGRTGPYSDQFSLAATLYALLTRTKPADAIQRVLGKTTLLPLRELNPRVPENVADAILKALSLQPSDRFKSVVEFQAALKDPAFRIDDQERSLITSTVTRKVSAPTQVASQSLQATVADTGLMQRRKRGAALWIVGGLLFVLVIVAALFMFVIPDNPLSLAGSRSTATPTEVKNTRVVPVDDPTSTPTLTLTATLEPSPTSEPTATETPEPTLTATPELLGETGMIVFASDRGAEGIVQIWTMRVFRDAQGQIGSDSFTQLTFDPGDKDQPVWSPDGSRIAYVAPGAEGNGLDIWVMDADGSNQINLTNHSGDEFDPVYALTWMKPDGTERKRLSVDFIEYDPTFSPDMNWLLYVISANDHKYFFFRGAHDGYTSPRGFDLRALFGEFGTVSDPAWAPVGNQFAYTELTSSTAKIVLVTYDEIQRNGVHQPKEYVLTESNFDTDPAWSPDARFIAFTSTRDSGDLEIYVMNTTGRPEINLTMREGVDKSPDWKPAP